MLQGLLKVICYLDDILVSRATREEYLQNLENVLPRLQQYNIRAKRSKCAFMCESVDYLDHRIDATGLHTLSSKVKAVRNAPQPKNVQELRVFFIIMESFY